MKRLLLSLSFAFLPTLAHAEQVEVITNFAGPLPIPALGPGGGGTWPTVLPTDPSISSVTLTHEVGRVYSVRLFGLSHGCVGDVQAVLRSPSGKAYNVFVRSGFDGGTTFNDGDFVGGEYAFVNAVTGTGAPFPGALNTDIPAAVYLQDFGDSGSPPAHWPDGSAGIFNVPLNQIHDVAGTWSLELYDWFEHKTGSFTGWAMSVERPSIIPYCFGDGTLPTACPCANTGAAGRGCENSASTGGAQLSATGLFTPDQIVMTVTGELSSALSIFIEGGQVTAGLPFGDGVRCFIGTTKRLYVKNAVGGIVSAPAAGDASITQRSSDLGLPITHGATFTYQVFYRDANATFCPAPSGSTFNVSNALRITWP